MICINCGTYMEGDGYKQVLHCPDAVGEDFISCEPDADAVYCRHVTDADAVYCRHVTDADAVYCRHVTDDVARELRLPVTSIPKLIKQYGSMAKVHRLLNISEVTVTKYRFDRDCDKHIIINGRLFTVRAGYERGKTK